MRRIGWLAWLGVVACGTDKPAEDCAPSLKIDVWADADSDGAGDPETATRVCALTDAQVTNADDCDDTDPDVSPFSPEICDGLDQDCDLVPDDGLVGGTWYVDTDEDGYGDPAAEVKGCMQPSGTTLDKTDCDDSHADAYPGAPEICDGYDNNCDTLVDDADPLVDRTTGTFFYGDADGDLFGNEATGQQYCVNPNPGGLTEQGGDCDDGNPDRNPDAPEVCDTDDNNCDDLVDDEDPLLDLSTTDTFFEDLDGDGVGNDLVTVQACFLGPGLSNIGGDCDDTEPFLSDPNFWVADLDNDGVGAGPIIGAASCTAPGPDTAPQPPEDDCNDSDAAIYPGAPDVCDDGVDSDCDGEDSCAYTEDFEVGPPLPVEFTTSGSALWKHDGTNAYAGVYSAKNGNIGDSQVSHLYLVLDYSVDGTFSFFHEGDTEGGYDYLIFYIDGVFQFQRAGFWSWTQAVYNVPAGVHTMQWTYSKDGSVSTGADTVYIDDLEAIGGLP